MGEVISVISGKGGTGKTTVCAAVATCLAAEGKRVLCVDSDIGLRNLDIALGMMELPVVAFTDVLSGSYSVRDATRHPRLENLYLFTAPVRRAGVSVDSEAFGRFLRDAREEYDYCLIDAPAGIGSGFQLVTRHADRFLVVATPEPSSLRDAGSVAELLELAGKTDARLVINRVSPRIFSKMALTVDDIMDDVGLPLIGLIPEDPDVTLAAMQGEPLIYTTDGGAAQACLRISRRLRGVHMPLMKLR